MLTSNELAFTFGGFYAYATFGENRSRNATSAHRQTDANWFHNLSHAICYNYGADKNVPSHISRASNNLVVIKEAAT